MDEISPTPNSRLDDVQEGFYDCLTHLRVAELHHEIDKEDICEKMRVLGSLLRILASAHRNER